MNRIFLSHSSKEHELEEFVRALMNEKKPEPETKPESGNLRRFLYAGLFAVILILCAVFFMHDETVSDDVFDVAAHGTPEQIQKLIDNGIDIEIKTRNNDTLLITAAMYNTNPNVITKLLRAGANVLWHSGENTYGTAVFRAAQMNSNPEVLRVLLDAEDPSRRELILDGTIRFYNTLLGWAATMNSWKPQMTRFLVESGANVNARTDDGLTALMTSSMFAYNPGTLKILIDASADVNLQDKNGMTALMYAQHEPSAMSEVLLNASADVNIRNNNGMTALMYSAMRNSKRWSTIKSLLNHGADKNIRDKSGKTAYDYALGNENFDSSLLPLLSPDVTQ